MTIRLQEFGTNDAYPLTRERINQRR